MTSLDFSSGDQSPFWPAGLPSDINVPSGNVVENLMRAAETNGDGPAIFYYGSVMSYGELLGKVEALAGYLQHCGVGRGDRVILDMQNAPQYVIAFQAILRANAVVVPVNPMNTQREIEYILADSGAKLAICGNELLDRFLPALAGRALETVVCAYYADALIADTADRLPPVMSQDRSLISGEGVIDFEAALALALRPGDILTGGRDPAVMPYTSGTTGGPKACVHRHSAVSFTAAAQAIWYGLNAKSVMTCFMPLFHVAGMQASMNAGLYAGAALVIMTRWDRDLIPALFARHRVTWWSAAPTMIADVLASDAFSDECFLSLRVLTGGGSSMPEAMAERLRQRHGLVFCEAYGLTETISATHINPIAAPKPQCLGLPIFNTRSIIVDPATLAQLPTGELGEILVSGPQIMDGYYRRPAETGEVLVSFEGSIFLRTGDLGYVDRDGYFFIVDRLKRMVNVSGYKVWPAECEALLYKHPAVQECCVIAAPDSKSGERVKAFVVLRAGFAQTVSADDIIAYARNLMAIYKVPKEIEFVDVLPRSGSRKIDWRALQEQEWKKHNG